MSGRIFHITESQFKHITEVIKENNAIQKLILSAPDDITFKNSGCLNESKDAHMFCVRIGKTLIPESLVKVNYNRDGKVKVVLNESLRGYGITNKINNAFNSRNKR